MKDMIIGLVSVSDRASKGVYKDEGIPALKEWLRSAIASPAWRDETRLIADEQALIESTLVDLVDAKGCSLVLTTGGTGPAPRDVTPEATLAVADKVMPGFGEQMRAVSPGSIGARIRVTAGSRTQIRDVKAGSSYLSQNDLRAHFGLGPAAAVERIDVQWPSGRSDTVRDVAANQRITIQEGSGIVGREPFVR